ncbi:MAG: hypothetical protein HYY40_13585 [Bacteroidetes bacterium]|nr:hypothetical protein [Bacteroidota bacterium]
MFPLISLGGGGNTIAPKYVNEFLSIGVGARGLALGNSQVATIGDATSGYWNPAGLTRVDCDRQIAAMHNEYFAGIAKYDFVSLAAPVDATRSLAFSVIRFGIDDIPDTSELIDAEGNINYDRIKSFSATDWAFLFSFGKLTPVSGLRIGGNAKMIYRKAGEFAQGWGFGIDAAAQYTYGTWQFGAIARDITTTFTAWSFNTEKLADVFARTQNEIPENSMELALPKLIAGAGKKFYLNKKFSLLPEIDLDMTFDGKRNVPVRTNFVSIDPHLGLELSFNNFIFLRSGINNIQQVRDIDGSKSTVFQPNFGIGVRIKSLSIDYALTNIGQKTGLYSNVFSLKLNLNRKEAPQI